MLQKRIAPSGRTILKMIFRSGMLILRVAVNSKPIVIDSSKKRIQSLSSLAI
ncbi:hypothetical protein RU98_GL001670 [Enterococcus caccae]|nr:hypothetical protein RU98_GL001670 [Enterococcus caccae]